MTAEQRKVVKVAIDQATRARIRAEDKRIKGMTRSYLFEHGELKKPTFTAAQRKAMSERAKAQRRAQREAAAA